MYKFNMGLRGMTSGGLVGLSFGGIAGLLSLAILRATGTTMEEVRFWQYKWQDNRDQAIRDSIAKQSAGEADPLLEGHHEKFGTANLDLDKVVAGSEETTKEVEVKVAAVASKPEEPVKK